MARPTYEEASPRALCYYVGPEVRRLRPAVRSQVDNNSEPDQYRETNERIMSEPRIELVQLANGDIALRRSDNPDEPLVTITISDQVQDLLPMDKIDIAQSMVEAGIERYRDIQLERVEQQEIAVATGMLH